MTEQFKRKTAASFRRYDESASKWLLRKPSQVGAVLAGVILVALSAFTGINIVLRLLHVKSPLVVGYFEMSMLLMALLSVSAMAYCWYFGRHIRIGIILEKCGVSTNAFIDAASALLGAAFASAVTYSLIIQTRTALFFGTRTDVLGVPDAPFKLIFAIMMGHFALVLLRSFPVPSIFSKRQSQRFCVSVFLIEMEVKNHLKSPTNYTPAPLSFLLFSHRSQALMWLMGHPA